MTQESWRGKNHTDLAWNWETSGEEITQIQSTPHLALIRHSPLSALLLGPNNGLLAQAGKMDFMSVVYLVWSDSRFHLHDSLWSASNQMLDKLDPWKSIVPSGRCRWLFSGPGFLVCQQQL